MPLTPISNDLQLVTFFLKQVVEKLIWMLPDGHQVKREVDLVLDRLFETMSPMHFHLREVIFVVFNKVK